MQGSRKLLTGPGFPPRFPLVEPAEASLGPGQPGKLVLSETEAGLRWVDRKVLCLCHRQKPPCYLRP